MFESIKKTDLSDLVSKLFPFLLLLLVPVMVYGLLRYFSERMRLLILAGAAGAVLAFVFVFCVSSPLKRRIKYLSMLGLLIILPFQNSLNLLIGFSIRPLTLGLPIFFLVDDILAFWSLKRKRIRRLNLFDVSALSLIIFAVFYLPVSALAGSILGGAYGFVTQFQGLFAYFVIRKLSLNDDQVRKILVAMLISLVMMVGYGFFEFMWAQYRHIDWLVAHSSHPFVQDGANLVRGYYRQTMSGAAYYRSQSFELEFISFGYSGYVLSSTLLPGVLLSRRWRKNRWMWIALALAVLGLVSSVTISAIGIFFLAFWIVGWEGLRHRGNAKYAWVSLPVLAVVGLIVAGVLFPQVMTPIRQRLSSLSLSARHEVHTRGNLILWDRVSPFLIFGRGTGTSGPGSAKFFPSSQYDYFVENEYLSNIAEWGLPGLLFYLLFMFSLGRHILRMKRQYPYGSLGYALGVGLFSIFIGYVLVGFYHNVWGQSSIDVQFMTLLALWTRGQGLLGHSRQPQRMPVGKRKATDA
jgi:hypothetical protein